MEWFAISAVRINEVDVVDQNIASWNQVTTWLVALGALSRCA